MLASSLLRAAGAPASRRMACSIVGRQQAVGGVVAVARKHVVVVHPSRSFSVQAAVHAEAKKVRTPRAKATTTTTKKPKKKAAAPKLKSWEKMGPDGKLVPLPRATKPKRANAFAIFLTSRTKDLRNDVSLRDENGRFHVTKLAAAVGSEWRGLSDEEKKRYTDEADRLNAQYERDLERWRSSLTPEDIRRENSYIASQRKKGNKGTAMLRDPTKPKNPRTAFFAFYDAERKKGAFASLPLPEASKQAGAKWRDLPSSEKEPYEREAAADRERYQREAAAWKANRAA